MHHREIRVLSPGERDRASLVETIQRLGHHVVEPQPVGSQDPVEAVIVVDARSSVSSDWAGITAELHDHPGPVVLITNRPESDLTALSSTRHTIVVTGDDSDLGYDIAFRLCAMLQPPRSDAAAA